MRTPAAGAMASALLLAAAATAHAQGASGPVSQPPLTYDQLAPPLTDRPPPHATELAPPLKVEGPLQPIPGGGEPTEARRGPDLERDYEAQDYLTPAPPAQGWTRPPPTATDPEGETPGDAQIGLGRQYAPPAGDALAEPAGRDIIRMDERP